MADVLPSCIGMEGLLYLLYSGFVQANKSHRVRGFQLVRINPSGGELVPPNVTSSCISKSFQLVRINPSGGVYIESFSDSSVYQMCFQLVRINPSGGVFSEVAISKMSEDVSN